MRYEDAFARNIGLFSPAEQDRLRSATVLVAGVGGVGGIQAATLARFGIGKLILIDPGEFDPPDMNRQYGATCSTMGRNKAECTAALLKDVNPFMAIDWHGDRPSTNVLDELVAGASIVVDAIDYSDFEYKIFLARAARRAGLLNLTCPIPDFAAQMILFDPEGMSAEEFYGAPEDPLLWPGFSIDPKRFFGIGPRPQNIFDYIEGRTEHISTNAGAAALSGALLATEAALILSGKRPREAVVTAPKATYLDLFQRVYSVYDTLGL
jgi:molybdopterin/thiamine biosynthesis adenylyltransferase